MRKNSLKPFPKDKLKLFGIANNSQKEIESHGLTDYVFGKNSVLKNEVFNDICHDVDMVSTNTHDVFLAVNSETTKYIE